MEGGERPASVAESLVDYDATRTPASPGADADAVSQADTSKKGKRTSSATKSSKRTPTPPKSPKGGKKAAGKKDKEAQPSVDTSAQAPKQDPASKNLKPK